MSSGLLGHYEDSDEEEAPADQVSGTGSGEPAARETEAALASPPAGSPGSEGARAEDSAATLLRSRSGLVLSGSPDGSASDGSDGEASDAKADEGQDMLLPPSPEGPPDGDILERVKSLHDLRKRGKSIRDHIQASRDWSNPYILERVVKVFELDQYGSNFPKEIFDPSRIADHPSDFYDAPECERPPPPKRQKREKAGDEDARRRRNGASRTKSSTSLIAGDGPGDATQAVS
ncbi:unnamed protein product [Polarella glacialis]|uniref:SAP30-binding protein n=1 Tax=Polarella glacialis TaxID=89957 RepID=A0A813LFX1_POLGL|nr:unnamed protein product [Polarella glacialis]|mmetsp:Transcript_34163/g.54960  ORF Transcript_34163/g.54960 Transcript_34163/m.54960 type:complete len:233 (-) Transcript_34163:96-794(-)